MKRGYLSNVTIHADALARSAGFQTCCVADFQVGRAWNIARLAGLETRDTADLEVCATVVKFSVAKRLPTRKWFVQNGT
jgi:hypothetical protein